ncbi:hypothetical protein GQ600_4610 [Phytophthora cactorum]|nr:hypothetical protein GQ600_4610 [Phytophthora cactorum]
MGTRLLGQRLDCICSVRFSWDDSSGRVTRLRGTMDFLKPLLQVLGNLERLALYLSRLLLHLSI